MARWAKAVRALVQMSDIVEKGTWWMSEPAEGSIAYHRRKVVDHDLLARMDLANSPTSSGVECPLLKAFLRTLAFCTSSPPLHHPFRQDQQRSRCWWVPPRFQTSPAS